MGEFASRTRLTQKALRLYDAQVLLQPAVWIACHVGMPQGRGRAARVVAGVRRPIARCGRRWSCTSLRQGCINGVYDTPIMAPSLD
jgi:hypothetical protein